MCAALSKQFCEKQCAITFKSQNDLLPSHLSTCLLISIFTKQYPTLRLQREVAAFQRAAVFIQQIIFQSMWIKCIQKLHMTLNGGIFKSLFIKNKNKKNKKKHAATLSKQPRQKEYIHKIDLIMLTFVMNSFFSLAQ